jgi:hypothetical protein
MLMVKEADVPRPLQVQLIDFTSFSLMENALDVISDNAPYLVVLKKRPWQHMARKARSPKPLYSKVLTRWDIWINCSQGADLSTFSYGQEADSYRNLHRISQS